jgi:hypothetical protein
MHAEDQALSFSRPPALGVKARSWKRDHQELQSPTLQRAKIKKFLFEKDVDESGTRTHATFVTST